MWNLAIQSALVAVVVSATTTLALLLRSRRASFVSYAAFAMSVGFYYTASLIAWFFPTYAFNANISLISGGIAVFFSTSFFDILLGEAGVLAQNRRRKTYISSLAMIAVGLTPLAQIWWVKIAAFFLAVFLLSMRIRLLWQKAEEIPSAAERTRMNYLAIAGSLALFGFATDFVAFLAWPILPIGGISVALYLYFLSQTLLISRLLDLHELLGKAVVFVTLSALLAGVFGAFVFLADSRDGLFVFNTFMAAGVILILFDPLKAFLEQWTTRLFFREHLTFAREIRRSLRMLAGFVEIGPAVEYVLDQVYDHKRATHASIYTLDPEGANLTLQGHRGPNRFANFDQKTFPVFFKHVLSQNPILRDHIKRRIQRTRSRFNDTLLKLAKEHANLTEDTELLEGLDALNAELILPLWHSGQSFGFLALKDERLLEAYSKDEIAALQELCAQLAITVQNSRAFSVLKERDRLAAIGEMSAGLAHEIRNPLAAIKGAAQALDPTKIDDADRDLFEIMLDEVNRLNKVVSEFLDYARPFAGTFSPLQLNELVQKTVRLLDYDFADEIELSLDLEPDLPVVMGDAERLKQVLINLLLNARDALEGQGSIRLSTCAVHKSSAPLFSPPAKKRSHVEIRIQDSGPGISQKAREKIFIPFYTTKQKGTGLGLAMCQRIVQDHAGTVELRSIVGKGSTFIIRLPSSGVNVTPSQKQVIASEMACPN